MEFGDFLLYCPAFDIRKLMHGNFSWCLCFPNLKTCNCSTIFQSEFVDYLLSSSIVIVGSFMHITCVPVFVFSIKQNKNCLCLISSVHVNRASNVPLFIISCVCYLIKPMLQWRCIYFQHFYKTCWEQKTWHLLHSFLCQTKSSPCHTRSPIVTRNPVRSVLKSPICHMSLFFDVTLKPWIAAASLSFIWL